MSFADLEIEHLRAAKGHEGEFVACIATCEDFIFASGGSWNRPVFLASSDGHNVHRRSTPKCSGLRGLFVESPHRIFVVGEYGTIARTRDFGRTWHQISGGSSGCLYRIIKDPQGHLWVSADGGRVLHSEDGHAFKERETPVSGRLLGMTTAGDGRIFFVGGAAMFYDGRRFAELQIEQSGDLCSVTQTPSGSIITVGDGGQIFRSEDGLEFSPVPSPVSTDLEEVIVLDSEVIAVGASGVVLVSRDDGASFEQARTRLKGHLWSMAMDGDDLLVGADKGKIARLTSHPRRQSTKKDLFGGDS